MRHQEIQALLAACTNERFDAATHPVVCALLDIRKCIRVLTRSAPRKPVYEERCRVRLAKAVEYSKKELS